MKFPSPYSLFSTLQRVGAQIRMTNDETNALLTALIRMPTPLFRHWNFVIRH
jgi:hypothetical protein